MSLRPKAILWDNDGVLVDTEHLFFQASREVLSREGVELHRELYVEYSLRRGASVFELLGQPERVPALREVRDARYSELIGEGVDVLEGIPETLAVLHGRLPMAVVTSSGRAHFEQIHRPLGLLDYFDFVLAGGDYDRHKPHPDPYLAAAERLGLEPGECLAVEDSERGLQSARAAGIPCIVIPTELTREGDFGAASRVLETAAHLPELVGA